jgi:hypothetical protein
LSIGWVLLNKPFDRPNNQCEEKNQNRDLIDSMHHPQIEIGRFIGVRFLEYPDEIIPHFAKFEEFLKFVLFSHDFCCIS